MTTKRRNEKISNFDWAALLLVLAVVATELTCAFQAMRSQTGLKYGYPAGPYFFMGSVALLALAGDVRMLVRGGVSGTQRIARHLWRMCFAWFIASASIFLARPHLFPALMRKSGVLYLLTILMGIFSDGYVTGRLVVNGDAAATAANILAHRGLFQLAFAVYLIEMACQVAITALFYDLLKPAGRSVSLVAAFLGLTGSVIKTFSRVFFIAPLFVLWGLPFSSVFSREQVQDASLFFLKVN